MVSFYIINDGNQEELELTVTYDQTKLWCSAEDLKKEQMDSISSLGKVKSSKDPQRTSAHSFEEIGQESIYHEAMILSLHNEMIKISKYISVDFAAFLTDDMGGILDLYFSSVHIKEEFDKAGIRVGKSFAKQDFGLNGVSLSMEMNSIGVVKGSEHTNSIFSNWNCVCSPLYSDGVIRGYVDISFYKGLQIEFAIPFMQQIAENVTEKWMWSNPEMQLLRLEFSFEQFNLTAREKEVAQMWLCEKSALRISNELGISEGTVRNVVKSIYNKMNVTDRWQFTKKLSFNPVHNPELLYVK